jgi:hypothetical protein
MQDEEDRIEEEIEMLKRDKVRDDLTRMLCEAMAILEKYKIKLSPELTTWWRKHKEADAKEQERIKRKINRDRQRRLALEKLTMQERKLLGIKG